MHTLFTDISVHPIRQVGYTLNDVNGPELPLVRNASNDRSQPKADMAV
jgi:hypothetical protein